MQGYDVSAEDEKKAKEEGARRTRQGSRQTANERSRDKSRTREQSSNTRQSDASSTGKPQHGKTSKHASSKTSKASNVRAKRPSALGVFKIWVALGLASLKNISNGCNTETPKASDLKPHPLKCLGGDSRSANNYSVSDWMVTLQYADHVQCLCGAPSLRR